MLEQAANPSERIGAIDSRQFVVVRTGRAFVGGAGDDQERGEQVVGAVTPATAMAKRRRNWVMST